MSDNPSEIPSGFNTGPYRSEFFEGIIEHSNTVFYVCRNEPKYPFEYISKNVVIFGYEGMEFTSGRISWLQIVYPDDEVRLGTGFDEYLARDDIDESLMETYRIITRDGDIRWVLDQTYPVWNAGGEITHVQGMLIDITMQKNLEEELLHYKDHLESLVSDRTKQLENLNRELEIQKLSLEQKQIALQEVLTQIEMQNRQIKRDIVFNIERLLLPVLKVLKQRTSHPDDGYVTLLENTVREITSSFGREISDELIGLTPV